MTNRVGQTLGNYKLVERIGKGGFAEVYKGVHIYLGVATAVKVLETFDTDDKVQTFLTEARHVAELEHPNIIRIRDFDVEAGTPYLVMDYAAKGSLNNFLPPGRALPYITVVSYIKQIASALQYAHDKKNLIHRDVKPHNMLIMNDGGIVLSDFGIALIAQSSGQHEAVGTIAYIAPEQLHGYPCFASDQYSLGIVAYEWLSGNLPFQGTPMEIGAQHLNAQPPGLSGKVPASVEQVLLRALAKRPEERFPRVQDFADALESTYQREAQEAQNVTRPIPWDKITTTVPLEDPDAALSFVPGPPVPPMVSASVMISRYDDLLRDFHELHVSYQNQLQALQCRFEEEKVKTEAVLEEAQRRAIEGIERVKESVEKTNEKLGNSEWSYITRNKTLPTIRVPNSLDEINTYQEKVFQISRKIAYTLRGYNRRKVIYPAIINLIGIVGGGIILPFLLCDLIAWLAFSLGALAASSVRPAIGIISVVLFLVLAAAVLWFRDRIVTKRSITAYYTQFLQASWAVTSSASRQNEALQNARYQRITDLRARYKRDCEKLEQDLRASLPRYTALLARYLKEDGLLVAGWDDPQWQQWWPRQQAIPLVRLGVVSEADGFPPLPALTVCPGGDNILFKSPGAVKEKAVQTLQSLMLRLLVAQSPGKLRFTLIDPTGLGENVATFLKLADYDKQLINGKAWTKKDQIAQQLSELSDHMENVIQQYLRNQFPTIDDYNKVAGEIAEPYRILVVVGFPANFTIETAHQLTNIAVAGPRCGVYVLMTVDTERALPGFKIAELERVAKVIAWDGQSFIWHHKNVGACKIDLDVFPRPAIFGQLLTRIGEKALEAHQNIEIPFKWLIERHVIPEYRWWASDQKTGDEVVTPIGRMGAAKYQYFRLGKGTAHHMLIVGTTGSGKTNLLHVLIMSLSLIYNPDELEFYLIDFKTVGFPLYAHYKLPHARVVAIQSEREFGLSVLEGLETELERRKQLFSKARVQDIIQFRHVQSRVRMPRILLIIDEFQELFMQKDEIAKSAAEHLDRFVRTGRGLGIHVVLASQTLAGLSSLDRSTILDNSTISQMTVRVAMSMRYEKADSRLILSEDNTASSLLFQFRPGEAVYNAEGGAEAGNSRFQSFRLSNEELSVYLDAIRNLAQSHSYVPPYAQKIFDGSKNADVNENQELNLLLDAPTWKPGQEFATIWLGDPISLENATELQLRPRSGSNLLLIGQDEEVASGLIAIALFSLAAQYSPDAVQFYIIDGRLDTPYVDRLRHREKQIPHLVKIANRHTLASHFAEICNEIEKRMETGIDQSTSIYLLVYGLHRVRTLRSEEKTFSNLIKQFSNILCNGPEQNIHTLIWCDTLSNFSRSVGNTVLDEFELRIAFQMSESDSSMLIGSTASNELGPHRALLFKEGIGNLEKFIPYEPPSDEWLTQVVDRLNQKRQGS